MCTNVHLDILNIIVKNCLFYASSTKWIPARTEPRPGPARGCGEALCLSFATNETISKGCSFLSTWTCNPGTSTLSLISLKKRPSQNLSRPRIYLERSATEFSCRTCPRHPQITKIVKHVLKADTQQPFLRSQPQVKRAQDRIPPCGKPQ